MAKRASKKRSTTKQRSNTNGTSANLGFETKLWPAADKMRGHMDVSEYKHIVLGLIFLTYISDAFENTHFAGGDDLRLWAHAGRVRGTSECNAVACCLQRRKYE